MSIFHRRQAIVCYIEHNDKLEVYANLTKFLLNNYKQALDLLSNGCLTLERLMHELGVPPARACGRNAADGILAMACKSSWEQQTPRVNPIYMDCHYG